MTPRRLPNTKCRVHYTVVSGDFTKLKVPVQLDKIILRALWEKPTSDKKV